MLAVAARLRRAPTSIVVTRKELEVRGQRQGHGQKQRKGNQCLECKFTTHK